jgi:ribonucleoside-diphosphate reductase beta chain
MGPVNGMTPDDIKQYIRFIADWRLRQLGCPKSTA